MKGTADFGLRNSDCEDRVPERSAIRIPQSEIRNPKQSALYTARFAQVFCAVLLFMTGVASQFHLGQYVAYLGHGVGVLGRVMSIIMLTFSIMPMMTLPLGVAADVTGAGNLFTIMGVGLVVALMLMALFQRRHIFGETPRMVMASEPGEWSADGPHAEPLQPARPIATTAPPLEPVARHDQ